MMQVVCADIAPIMNPTGALKVDQWEQASKYDTLVPLFTVLRSMVEFSQEQTGRAPTVSIEEGVWKEFERGSSCGFDLLFLIDPPENDWSGIQLVRELRQLSGLTWQQAADLVGVSAKTLHNWAAGHMIAEKNLRRLGEVLAVLRFIDRGFGEANRELLLNASAKGRTLFSLLKEGDFESVKERAGGGPGRAGSAVPLAQEIVNRWGPEHFGASVSASLGDLDEDVILDAPSGKRPAKARRKG